MRANRDTISVPRLYISPELEEDAKEFGNMALYLTSVFVVVFLVMAGVGARRKDDLHDLGIKPSKIIVYGEDKVTLPTIKNILIVYSELCIQSLDHLPKEIRPFLKTLAYELQSLSVSTKKLIGEAEAIMKMIDNGRIKGPCDIRKEIYEILKLLVDILDSCDSDYTYHDKK